MENPWILFLYRVCQIGLIVAVLALLLLAAFTGFMLAPAGLEMQFASGAAILTGVFLVFDLRRENSVELHRNHRLP